jgi:hypothetical protein
MPEPKNVLLIGTWSSRCQACGRNADPNETHHLMENMVGEGCGLRFTAVGSNYRNIGEREFTKEMRPDLEWSDDIG